jgi:putative membrane protein
MERTLADNKAYLRFIYVVSGIIPIVVAFLIFFPSKLSFAGSWVYMLPKVHAIINSLTVIVLVAALIAVKAKRITLHRSLMTTALVLGFLFLLSYVTYHSSVESVKFGDIDHDGIVSASEKATVGNSRTVYLLILASHILLSIGVIPFVLFAFYFSLTNQIKKHKKIVRYTFPIWLYVSITGVVVYLMIQPYYL